MRLVHLDSRPATEIEEDEGARLPHAVVGMRGESEDRSKCPLLQDGGVVFFSRDDTGEKRAKETRRWRREYRG